MPKVPLAAINRLRSSYSKLRVGGKQAIGDRGDVAVVVIAVSKVLLVAGSGAVGHPELFGSKVQFVRLLAICSR